MSVSRYDEWFNHFTDEPIGYVAEVHRHSMTCSILSNGFFQPKTPYKTEDFKYPAVKRTKPKTLENWKYAKGMMQLMTNGKRSSN